MWKSVTCCVGIVFLAIAPALAQENERQNRWGVGGSISPSWRVPEGSGPLAKLAEVSLTSGDLGYDIAGADFRIGVVRGRDGGGDWGVSLVRRTFKEGSTQGAIVTECILGISCYVYGTEYRYQDAALTGVEANKFISFGTIRNVLQFGIDLAVGVGWYQREVERRDAFNRFTETSTEPILGFLSEQVPASELSSLDPMMLGRAELAAAVLLRRGLKVRVSGGMNYPGAHVASVSLMYFFGAN